MSDDLTGRLLGARFRLEKQLGAGGMGAVYAAIDTANGQSIAVKVIREGLAENPEAIERFEREVKATAALNHENIVRFLDAGQEGGLRWLAMELLQGRTLKDRIASRGAMPWRDTLPVLRGVVKALGAAHAAGLIHRDLKPENVFLVDDPSLGPTPHVKLLDFGVAKHTALPEGMTMTGTGIIVGTPGFVAPEVVLLGVANDPRSDFYGLGATWFEMLTGAKPFSAATPFALAMRHLNERPPRPTDLVPYAPIPAPVETLLSQLLEKEPAKRPATAELLLAALDAIETAAATAATSPATPLPVTTTFDKTITDMATPRPDVLAMHGLAKSTPDTGSMRVLPGPTIGDMLPAVAQPIAAAEPTRRRALIAAAVVAVSLLAGIGLVARRRNPRNERRGRRADPDDAPVSPPARQVDAGSAAVAAPTDAGTLTPRDAGVSARPDAGRRRGGRRRDAGPQVEFHLDLPPTE